MDFKKLDMDKIMQMPDIRRPELQLPRFDLPGGKSIIQEQLEGQQQFFEQALVLLTDIKQNTANLSTILDLIAKSNTNQEEIIEIIKELLSLATIKDNPEKAQSLYRKTMDKINKMTTDINTMQKLYGFGLLIYQTLHDLGIM